jgi:hypothetical protein
MGKVALAEISRKLDAHFEESAKHRRKIEKAFYATACNPEHTLRSVSPMTNVTLA